MKWKGSLHPSAPVFVWVPFLWPSGCCICTQMSISTALPWSCFPKAAVWTVLWGTNLPTDLGCCRYEVWRMCWDQRDRTTQTSQVELLRASVGGGRYSQSLLDTEDEWGNGITPERPRNYWDTRLGGLWFSMNFWWWKHNTCSVRGTKLRVGLKSLSKPQHIWQVHEDEEDTLGGV